MDAVDYIAVIQFLIVIALFFVAYKLGNLEGKVDGFIENHRKN